MTSPLHQYVSLHRGSDESLPCELRWLFPVEYSKTCFTGGEVCWSGFFRPTQQQELASIGRGRDHPHLSGLPSEHGYGGVPSFRVHGAAPRGVAA